MHLLELNDSLFRLPSGGAYDPEKVPLLEGGKVKVRSWVVDHERQFASVLGCGDAHKIFYTLLESLVVEPKALKFDELLLSDIFSILYAVKEKSFGPIMEVNFSCPACKVGNVHELSIPELLVKYPEDIEGYMSEGLEITLSSSRVTCHLPRLKDQKAVTQFIKHLEKSGRLKNRDKDEELVYCAQIIDSINGVAATSIQEKFQRILEWSPTDILDFAQFVDEMDTGLILNQTAASCRGCGRQIDLNMSVGPDFFRAPSSRRRKPSRTYM